MSLKDINLNEDGEAIIIDQDFGTDTLSEDQIFWRLRNLIIKLFVRSGDVWKRFKGSRVLDRVAFEEEVKDAMLEEINRYYPNESEILMLKIEVLFMAGTLHVFSFRMEPYLSQDKKLIDFKIEV